jgi:hypothetical protein
MPWRATISTAVGLLAITLMPGSAAAVTNPYTAASACHNDFGGTWVGVADNRRDVRTPDGRKFGDVYLMWNDDTKENCVATIKRVFIGTESDTSAEILVEGSSWKWDDDSYKYYAAVKAPACNKEVRFAGEMWSPDGPPFDVANGERFEWGNGGC